MVLSRSFEPPDLVAATLAGVVTASDQAALVRFVRATIQTTGPITVLLRLEQFAGWNADTRFDSHTVWLRDDEGVSRIAVVGEPGWRLAVMTLMAQPVRKIPIAYFDTEEAARRWLKGATRVSQPVAAT